MEQRKRAYGWAGLGPWTRTAVVVLAVNAIAFLVLGAVLREAWPFFVFAPSALLDGMIVRYAFAAPDLDEE